MKLFIRNFLIIAAAAIVLGSSALTFSTHGQATTTKPNRPFEPTEELFYEAEFSRSLLHKIDVADFKFRATQTFLNSATQQNPKPYSLNFTAEIASKGFFTRLFNLNFHERVESTVEPVSFTVERTTIHDEQGKRVRNTEAVFDREKGKMLWTQRDPNNPSGEPRNIVTEFSGQLQDVLSAIYFIRTQKLEVGKSFEISIADGGRIYQVPIKVVEKRKMKTVLGSVNVLRLDPELFGPGRIINDNEGHFTLWITDDQRRIPVGGRIKTEYGTFDISLKRAVYNPPA